MDIYLIKVTNIKNIDETTLKKFQKKRISNHNKLYTHCISYFILDKILKEIYQLNEREIVFDENKPVLKNKKKHFSISHSKEYIALCFSDYKCGIDVERIRDDINWVNISDTMGFNSQSKEEFYKNWTKYEANYKLNCECKTIYNLQFDKYFLTAVSNNDEIVNIYEYKINDIKGLTTILNL